MTSIYRARCARSNVPVAAVATGFALLVFTAPVAAAECLLDTIPDGFLSTQVGFDGTGAPLGDTDGAAQSSSPTSLACGNLAAATSTNATAIGSSSQAIAANSTAIGQQALASGANSVAVGQGAQATFGGSTALGQGAVATAANQVALGGAGTTVRLGGYSTAGVLLTDANGVLSSNTTLVPAVALLQSGLTAAQSNIGVLQDNVAVLQSLSATQGAQINSLFDLSSTDRRDTRKGIAAVTAMAQPHFPSASGRTSYASNVGFYRGEVGFSAGAMHRFEGSFGLSAGVSYAGKKHVALKAGVAGEF